MTLRNVIYYNDNANQIPLAGIVNLPYTDVIIGFLVPGPDGTTLVGGGGPNGGALTISSETISVFCKTPAGVF